jgi:Pentapeptide repeats (8 copies)
MSASQAQAWVAVVGGLVTAVVALFKFFNYRSKSDDQALVGEAFSLVVDRLSDEKLSKQIAAAVLLRRFFDPHTEQGKRGLAYKSEAVNVIAGMLREKHDARLQKALADGLRYARVLTSVDLQQCDMTSAYLGKKQGDDWALDLSHADMYEAKLDGASLKYVTAVEAVFYQASLKGTVFDHAVLTKADFRSAELAGAKFRGAVIGRPNSRGRRTSRRRSRVFLTPSWLRSPGRRCPTPRNVHDVKRVR